MLTIAGGIFLVPSPSLTAADTNTISAVRGDKLYAQFNLFYENKVHLTTNYRIGTLAPTNTEVTYVKANKKLIEVILPDGTHLKIENVENTRAKISTAFFTALWVKQLWILPAVM